MNVPHSAPTCVWMSAGVLNYKLCDRNYNCEHCPLDAALRGVAPECQSGRSKSHGLLTYRDGFPSDRHYTRGHTWVQPHADGSGSIRIGLDRFAVEHLPRITLVRWAGDSSSYDAGRVLCRLFFDGVSLPLECPFAISGYEPNPVLENESEVVSADPYERGWIADLVPADPHVLDTVSLLDARQATRLASVESRRLRRCLAFHLLVQDDSRPTSSLQNEHRLLDNLRHLLGAPRFLQLLGELVH
ncbi:MAG: hypothetical protein HND57_09245 [Planctomycetes bacterium]|nr:hypothetical protein [Planctomycetota bacterium]